MATYYYNGGTDLDQIYAPNKSGTYSIPSGFSVNGQDLAFRFERIQYGSRAGNVNFSGNGRGFANASDLWAAMGTPQYQLPFNGVNYWDSQSGLTGQTGSTTASAGFTMAPDGAWYASPNARPSGSPRSGTWVPAGRSPSDFSIYFNYSWQVGSGTTVQPTYGGSALGVWVRMNPGVYADANVRASVDNKFSAYSDGNLTVNVQMIDNVQGGQRDLGTFILSATALSQY